METELQVLLAGHHVPSVLPAHEVQVVRAGKVRRAVHLPEEEHCGVCWLDRKLPTQSLSLVQVQ